MDHGLSGSDALKNKDFPRSVLLQQVAEIALNTGKNASGSVAFLRDTGLAAAVLLNAEDESEALASPSSDD